jgi:hypothetical protein
MELLQETGSSIGNLVVHLIIGLAQILTKSQSAPGIVAILLIVMLAAFGLRFWMAKRLQINAIRSMKSLLAKYETIPDFASGYEEFRARLSEKKNSTASWKDLWEAWDEFSETIVIDDVDGPPKLRNSIRPASFMNVEDLGFGPGAYRVLPNVFVSVGLLLTFLGLVAALFDFSRAMAGGAASDAGMDTAMTAFMQIASAKFVMSLVGLFCSILFAILLRRQTGLVDRELHRLCLMIERRLVFVSLEDLGFRQLKAATEQREHLREIGFSMVAELRKPLEALPEQITSSISKEMGPILDRVSAMGTSSMEGLVGDLSSQLSHSVGNALNRASESLGEASDRMGQMVDRMNASNAQAGEGLQAALSQLSDALSDLRSEVAATGSAASTVMQDGADQLLGVMNETLTGIRDNTAQGANAMRAAADEMRKAAEGFREQIAAAATDGAAAVQGQMEKTSTEASTAISGAGHAMLGAYEAASRRIAELGSEMGDAVGEELIGRLEAVGMQLEEMATAIERGASGARAAAEGLTEGAQSISRASAGFDTASRSLVSATEPLRSSH